ncbi:MAG: hypothetical protein WC637_00605 [Victivallales bacterium]
MSDCIIYDWRRTDGELLLSIFTEEDVTEWEDYIRQGKDQCSDKEDRNHVEGRNRNEIIHK